MFWAGIPIDGKTEFKCVSRTGGACGQRSLTAHQYITEILKEHVLYVGFVGNGLTLMHDCACSHTALIVRSNMEEIGIPVKQWPARSPGLNLIDWLTDLTGLT